MSRRHGRATIPFGKFKGVRVSLLKDSYLSFLTTLPWMHEPQWRWLYDSVLAELRFRDFNTVGIEREDVIAEHAEPVVEIFSKRAISLEK